MLIFIAVVLVVFIFVVVSLNFQKINGKLGSFKKEKKADIPDKSKEKAEDNLSYEEYEPTKVDSLHEEFDTSYLSELNQNPDVNVSVLSLSEEEAKELSSDEKSNAGGRKQGDIVSTDEIDVQVENMGDYDEDFEGESDLDKQDSLVEDLDETSDFEIEDDEDFELDEEFAFMDTERTISDEIKELSPELKALLIDNVLNKKD